VSQGGAWVAIITSILAGLAGFAALIRTFLERPKMRADAMTLVTQAATDQMKTIRDDNTDVRARLTLVETKLETALVRLSEANDKIDATQDQLEVSEKHNRLLTKQNRILMDYARRTRDWCDRYYNSGHPPGMEPPPPLPLFHDDTDPNLLRKVR
jgi:septal ring factor EnvC (AmiA/AmiB activator)